MKNLKLTIFSAIFLAFSALTSCTKEGITVPVTVPIPPTPPAPPAATTNAVYYVDSAKIYSTSLTGSDRRLVVGIDTLSTNSYISSAVRSNDGNKLYFFHYNYSAGTQFIKLYSVNKDGTGLTVLKNMPANGPEYVLLKQTADNKLVFSQFTFTPPSSYINTLQTINADGTNQVTFITVPAGSYYPSQLSATFNRYATVESVAGTTINTLKTGSITGTTIGAPATVGNLLSSNSSSLSNDGTKIAYAKLNAAGKIEIYVYDVATAASLLKFTHTVVSTIPTIGDVSVRWVAGTDKILLGYGKSTAPIGSASDFTQLTLYTLSNSAELTWRFEGDNIYKIVTE